jgi:hypothetical protein
MYVHCVCVVMRRVYDMYSVYVREDIVDVEYICKLCMYRACICYVWMGIVDGHYRINVRCLCAVCVYTYDKSL